MLYTSFREQGMKYPKVLLPHARILLRFVSAPRAKRDDNVEIRVLRQQLSPAVTQADMSSY